MWSNIISWVALMSELINNKLCFYEPFEIISSDCPTASNILIAGAIALITQKKKWFVVTTYHSNIERTDRHWKVYSFYAKRLRATTLILPFINNLKSSFKDCYK